MSRNIVFEGWLTKSPPSKRIWRTKWRRRWFALRQSGELPGQYFLDYYADRNCRRLKGTINLDLCEQVDAGLHMERAGNGTLDPKIRGSVFTIQTQSRTYHLEADCEAEMAKWVDAICRVCGLRPTEEDTYQNNSAVSATNDHYECVDTTGPYIPISECITGVRAQDGQSAFTFDPKNIVVSTQKTTCDKATETGGSQIYIDPPRIKVTHVDFSENESNLSDEDCKSLNASQSNIPGWSVTKSFTKLAVISNRNGASEDGPPVPPRPPKTFARASNPVLRENSQGPRIQEPVDPVQESISRYPGPGTPWLRVPARSSHCPESQSPSRSFTIAPGASRLTDDEDESSSHQRYIGPGTPRLHAPRRSSHYPAPQSPSRIFTISSSAMRLTDDEEENSQQRYTGPGTPWLRPPRRSSHHPVPRLTDDEEENSQQSLQYYNLPPLPPAVDRALKPRYSSHSVGHINSPPPPEVSRICTDEMCPVKLAVEGMISNQDESKSVTLQYLDLDLHTTPMPTSSENSDLPRKVDIIHGKSMSAVDAESAYKTVDFLKTEAFNSTRQDAEALRSYQN